MQKLKIIELCNFKTNYRVMYDGLEPISPLQDGENADRSYNTELNEQWPRVRLNFVL